MIYFDSAATTLQKPPAVPRAVAWAIQPLLQPWPGRFPKPPAGQNRSCLPAGGSWSELFEARDRNGWCLPSMPPTP